MMTVPGIERFYATDQIEDLSVNSYANDTTPGLIMLRLDDADECLRLVVSTKQAKMIIWQLAAAIQRDSALRGSRRGGIL